ncbi:unnamed protein product [Diatraea saccharalis]|uniref:NADP-dependent oxidoreductase domain-containing protein n=1 Tax=Diatraea saccharalis TaxID=40085 RepID=A0A9N9RD46_9NEOP|nr:unnamed protein product [Diatraea saccharalis]
MDARSLWLILAIVAVSKSTGVAPRLKLNDGKEIPALGLGTWLGFTKEGTRVPVQGDEVENAVQWAIDAGYRHIDTAAIYNTELQVGRAVNKKIAEGVIKREDVFITTKLWNTRHAKEDVVPALKESLQKLNLTYVDLYLIHWPISESEDQKFLDIDYVDTWRGMEEARAQGLTRSIGVSNFNQAQLERLISLTNSKPASLQIEINLNLQQPDLLAYCKRQGILVTGYTPFGSLFSDKTTEEVPPPRADDTSLVAIAQKYNKTVAQIALRYEVELGVIPIPKSIHKKRIEQNINVFDFELTQEERDVLKAFDKNYRVIAATHWKGSPHYPFEKN